MRITSYKRMTLFIFCSISIALIAGCPMLTAPPAMFAPTLAAGNGQLTASWIDPATWNWRSNNAGNDVTEYNLRYRHMSSENWIEINSGITGTSHTITELTNGISYAVQVRAANAQRTGGWSTSSTASPITVPAAPAAPTLEAENGQLIATWTAPDNGGSAISAYNLRHGEDGSGIWKNITIASGLGTSMNRVITRLANGISYAVQVRAINARGEGAWSEPSTAAPDPTLPAAPTDLRLEVGDASLTMSWTAPTDSGSSAISAYYLRYSEDGSGIWKNITIASGLGTSMNHVITGLANGRVYEAQVRAINARGEGAWSEPSTATPSTVPAAPKAPVLKVGNSSFTATWTAPDDGGNAISAYYLRYSENGSGIWKNITIASGLGTSMNRVITGLANGRVYEAQVRAINARGEGAWSEPSTAAPATVPAAPKAPVLEVGNSSFTATWTAPDDGGNAISAYYLRYSENGSGIWKNITIASGLGTSMNRVITGLANGRVYEAQVRAVNALGESAWSEPSTATPITVPAAPNPPTLTAGRGSLTVTWTAPADNGGSAISAYNLQYREDNGDWTQIASGITGTSHTIRGLISGLPYPMQVRAVNAQGAGAWSESSTGTPTTRFSNNTANIGNSGNLNLDDVSSVATAEVGGAVYLFVTGYTSNGVSVFRVNSGGTLTNVDNEPDTGDLFLEGASDVTTAEVGNAVYLFVAGAIDNGISVFRVNSGGTLTNVDNEPDTDNLFLDRSTLTTAVIGNATYLFAAGSSDYGISVFRVNSNGTLTNVDNEPDTSFLKLAAPKGLTAVEIGGTALLFAASFTEDAVTMFSADNAGTLEYKHYVYDTFLRKLDGAWGLATAAINDAVYLFVTGYFDNGVSVFLISNTGFLKNTDNKTDNATLHLRTASDITTAVINGITYLFVVGLLDNGISMFRVNAEGTLTNVDNIADTSTLHLNGSNALTTAVIGSVTYLFVTGVVDDGVSVFAMDDH